LFDIHYHLLYGLDDGPKTIEDSLALAEASIAEGVTHIVATPHCNYEFKFDPKVNRERAAELQDALKGRLTIGLGCDLHLSYDNVQDALEKPTKYSINGGRYVLVELADTSIPVQLNDILFQMRLAGMVPIITHPERNPLIMRNPARIFEWVRDGCLVQLTGASLAGRFGQGPQRACFRWIEDGWVHLLASDAHNLKWRAPSMREAYETVTKHFGQVTADRLCLHNPRVIFQDDDLPQQPYPAEPRPQYLPRKQGFFSRLFGR
jgi:protein-tyrosine phosphatase